MQETRALIAESESYIIEQRRWFHQHPELSWQEKNTTAHIAGELKAMGLEPHFFPDGRTGLYAMIRGGKASASSGTIMLRADMDALPVTEKTGLSYSSIYPGLMHACGHDCHMAMLLGAARVLSQRKDKLTGNVKLFFQGAEETALGAKYYVDQGILDGVDAVYGCHVNIDYPAGMIKLYEGMCMPSCDEFLIEVEGVSTHGALPHQGRDAIVAASAIVNALQTLVSRTNDPLNPLVISIGHISGGRQYNIVCSHVEMKGTVRTFSRQMRAQMDRLMDNVISNTAEAYGCKARLNYMFKTGPVIHDSEEMNALVRDCALSVYGQDNISKENMGTFSDDFAFFSEARPAFYAMIGARNDQTGCCYPHHHECFNIDESVLAKGARMFVEVAERFLQTDLKGEECK